MSVDAAVTASAAGAPNLISLKHIKEETGEYMKKGPPRKAWPGGKLVSNKEQAVVKFIERKRSRGESLTEEQLAVLEKYHAPDVVGLVTSPLPVILSNTSKPSSSDNVRHGQRRKGSERPKSRGKTPDSKRPRKDTDKSSGGKGSAAAIADTTRKLDMSLDALITKGSTPKR